MIDNIAIRLRPKLYFLDTGLAASLLSIQRPTDLRNHPMRGALFESWVVSELVKGRFNRGRSDQLYFWRSHVGQEVDIVVDHGTTLLPIECKSGRALASDWFDAIDAWNILAGDVGEPPVLVYGGDRSLIHRGTRAVSWSDIDTLASEV